MKKVVTKLVKYTGVFLLILALGLTNGLSNLLSEVGLQQLAQEIRIKPAYAATLEYVGGAEASGANVDYAVSLTALTGGSGSAAAANDLVIVATGFTGTANGDPRVTTAGYTEEVGGVDLWANDTNDANLSVNWKIMGSTPDTSVTCGGSAGSTIGAVCVVQVWRNAAVTPMDVTATTATGTNSTLFNSASITPVTSGAVVISAGLAGMGAADTSITAPTGYGNQVDISVDPGTAATVGISSKAWSGSGAEDPAAWTNITTSTSDGWAAYTLALRPSNDPPTITVDNPPAGNTNVAEGSSYNIQYDLADADSTATVDFYYETDGDGAGGTAIAACQNQAEGINATCSFSTSILSVSTAYYIYGVADDTVNPSVTDVSSGTITVNDAPTISVSQPPSGNTAVAEGSSYNVTYTLNDTDNVVTAAFYYDTDSDGIGGTAISGACATAAEGTGVTCSFNTSVLTPSTAYYIYGTTNDGVNASVTGVSAGTITVNDAPTFSISQPDGVGDSVSEGDPYAITYTLGDTDNVVTTAFYYDDSSSGLDGIAITGACATAAEGTDVTCSWDTSGVTPGTYYVYGITNDGVNAQVSQYSSGQITINSSVVDEISVGTSGTQPAVMAIPSNDNNMVSRFSFERTNDTANVTQIIMTEIGTVDANANISDVVLYYKQEVTCSESIPGDATQFNSTPGTFNVSEKTTVTGTMAVGTSKICVYVRVDVGSGTSHGDTLRLRIANPSTEVTVSAGTVAPTSDVTFTGTTTLQIPEITVATEGTQANIAIGTGDNNVGGAFSFTRDMGSADVTSLIITDTGTVNANANISDVRVYYKQEGTCSSTIPVDATLFNSSAGTFNGSEKSTVTGTMSVGTSKICVYVRVDVGDGAADAETLEIEISNPSTEVTASAGSVAPATAVAIAGTTTLNLPTYTSQGIPFLYTSANWGTDGSGVSFYLEVYMRQTTGTAYARLYNETDSTAVTSSQLSTTSSSFTRVRSSALALTNGKTYRVQFGKIGADAGETLGGKLVVNQNQGGGGADLAEYYSSSDQLDLAEVVSIDPTKVAGVKRSDKPYQKDMLGVVATQPGIILGENVGQSYPIALVGRVPVKVTTENGQIRSGDYLTSASTPGYGMKATKAGRVLGQALETLDPSKTHGTVMVFVNLIDYLGSPVELVMAERKQTTGMESVQTEDNVILNASEGSLANASTPTSSEILRFAQNDKEGQNDNVSRQQQILSFLKELKAEKDPSANSGQAFSEVFTDRVSATSEIISPLIITDLLYAKKIKADSIEGLEILTNKISYLNDQNDNLNLKTEALAGEIAGIATSSAGLSTEVKNTGSSKMAVMGKLTIESAQITLDLSVLGKLSSDGGLTVGGPAHFAGETLFDKLVTFVSNVIFKGKVTFEEVPTFNKDTAGFALIKNGERKIKIEFEKEYQDIPVITANKIWNIENDTLSVIDKLDGFFLPRQDYLIAGVTKKGFTIVLEEPTVTDLKFSWIAIAVDQVKTYESSSSGQVAGASIDISQIKPSPWVDAGLPTPTIGVTSSLIPSVISISPTPTITIIPTLIPTIVIPTLIPQKTVTVLPNEYGFVRLRKTPTIEGIETDRLEIGASYPYLEKRYDWYQIKTGEKTGWVSGTYVSEN